MILDELLESNEFPIIFIGAGISKRYLENYPSWLDLLENMWRCVETKDFYSELNIIENNIKEELGEKEKDFRINTTIASELQNIINRNFNNQTLKIDGIDSKTVFTKKIDPFKKFLSNRFVNYEIKDDMNDEIKMFSKVLNKSRIILTTNYDTFIEERFEEINPGILNKYIGQRGLFQSELGYCDLYKIHGCCSDPNSIVITENDYITYDKNSVLISAKIISLLLNSPIIFLGYSLTDINIRNIIKNFSSSLTQEERKRFEKRIIIINRKANEQNLVEEKITDKELNCSFTVINTDNFLEIYKKISKIDQGVTPAEISRFQHVIKRLIVEKGKSKDLDKVFVNFISKNDMENIDEYIKNNNVAVAVGDSAIIVKIPSIIDYLYRYISGLEEDSIEVNLRFLALQNLGKTFPALKYLTTSNISLSKLYQQEKINLEKRLKKLYEFKYDNVLEKYQPFEKISDILDNCEKDYTKSETKDRMIKLLIIKNFDDISIDEIKDYILNELNIMKTNKKENISTHFRKLLIKYDFKVNHKKNSV